MPGAVGGARVVFFHAHPEKLAELGRQGGQKNRHWMSDGCELPTMPLKRVDDVLELLEETINMDQARTVRS